MGALALGRPRAFHLLCREEFSRLTLFQHFFYPASRFLGQTWLRKQRSSVLLEGMRRSLKRQDAECAEEEGNGWAVSSQAMISARAFTPNPSELAAALISQTRSAPVPGWTRRSWRRFRKADDFGKRDRVNGFGEHPLEKRIVGVRRKVQPGGGSHGISEFRKARHSLNESVSAGESSCTSTNSPSWLSSNASP